MTHELQACIFITVAWLVLLGITLKKSEGMESLVVLGMGGWATIILFVGMWVVYALGIYNGWVGEKGILEFAKTDGLVMYSVKLHDRTYSKVLPVNDVRNPGLQMNKEVIVEFNHNLYGAEKGSRVKSLDGQVLFE